MANPLDKQRRYNERETALILKLASQLETRVESDGGLSLNEIQQVAIEAGIDPDLVAEAALALEVGGAGGTSAFWGGRTQIRFQRSVEGEPSKASLSAAIEIIRRVMETEGEVVEVLDAVEWRHQDPLGAATHIEISPRAGRTQVRVNSRQRDPASLLYGMFAIGATVASVVAGTEIQGPIIAELAAIAGLWGAAYLGARSTWRRISGRVERRLRALTDAVAGELGGSATDSEAPRAELPGSGIEEEGV